MHNDPPLPLTTYVFRDLRRAPPHTGLPEHAGISTLIWGFLPPQVGEPGVPTTLMWYMVEQASMELVVPSLATDSPTPHSTLPPRSGPRLVFAVVLAVLVAVPHHHRSGRCKGSTGVGRSNRLIPTSAMPAEEGSTLHRDSASTYRRETLRFPAEWSGVEWSAGKGEVLLWRDQIDWVVKEWNTATQRRDIKVVNT